MRSSWKSRILNLKKRNTASWTHLGSLPISLALCQKNYFCIFLHNCLFAKSCSMLERILLLCISASLPKFQILQNIHTYFHICDPVVLFFSVKVSCFPFLSCWSIVIQSVPKRLLNGLAWLCCLKTRSH